MWYNQCALKSFEYQERVLSCNNAWILSCDNALFRFFNEKKNNTIVAYVEGIIDKLTTLGE